MQSRTLTDEDLNAILNPNHDNENCNSEASEEETIPGKVYWAKAADSYFTLLKFAERVSHVTQHRKLFNCTS